MKRIGINVNTTKDTDGNILQYVKETIKKYIDNVEIEVFNDSQDMDYYRIKNLDMMMVLGGDGTILRTARALEKYTLPILGINIGNLGFLASIEISELGNAMEAICIGKYSLEKRMMIKCILNHNGAMQEYGALNDIVITKGTLSRIVDFNIEINGNFYTDFTSDGVIVSTPTGSTAYSLSAGGPIVYPTLDIISITPICPHTLELRTVIVDGKSKVKIKIKSKNESESVFLTIDGQQAVQLEKQDEVLVEISEGKCNLIKLEGKNYFEILRKKLITRSSVYEGEN